MFTNISWNNYIGVIVMLSVSWYLFVGFRFYFAEIKDIVTGKRKLQFRGLGGTRYSEPHYNLGHQESPEMTSPQSSFGESDQTFQDVDNLVGKLKNVVADAGQRKLVKQEFMDYLALVLTEYPSVKNSPFRSSVSELIVSECDKLEAIHLTQEEVEGLWNEKK